MTNEPCHQVCILVELVARRRELGLLVLLPYCFTKKQKTIPNSKLAKVITKVS